VDDGPAEVSGAGLFTAAGPHQILVAVESMPSPSTAVLAIGGSAAGHDVAVHLSAGRVARAADGHVLVLYDEPGAAVRDVAGYLRPRAMTMVRFGLYVGAPPHAVGDRLTGPAVSAATRLADLAAPGRLRIGAATAELLGGTVPLEATGDGSYQMQKGFGTG
jgi:class 3 adenylate cyclase